jgi:hypothetical protein
MIETWMTISKQPLSKRKNSSTLKQKGSKEKYENYKTFGLPSNKRVGWALKILVQDRISSTKITRQATHAQKSNGYLSATSIEKIISQPIIEGKSNLGLWANISRTKCRFQRGIMLPKFGNK